MLGSHKISVGLRHPGLYHVYLSSHVRCSWLGVDKRRASGAHGRRSLVRERLASALIARRELAAVRGRSKLLLRGIWRRLLLVVIVTASSTA